MSGSTRTFIALEIPQSIRARLASFTERIAPEAPDFRWVDPVSMHVTLAFLGDVDHKDLAKVCSAVGPAVVGQEPLRFEVRGVGAFPDPARPRTLWAGVSGPSAERLGTLRAAIVGAVARLGYPADEQRFHPHVTLGRLKERNRRVRPPDLQAMLQRHESWSAGAFEVAEVVTFESIPGPKGPCYNALSRAPLEIAKSTIVP
jgi:2'-5' RNA ligase